MHRDDLFICRHLTNTLFPGIPTGCGCLPSFGLPELAVAKGHTSSGIVLFLFFPDIFTIGARNYSGQFVVGR